MNPRLRPVVLLLALAAAVTGIALVAPRLFQRAEQVRRSAATPTKLVQPGPLSRHHAAVIDADDCRRCHDLAGSLPDAKCLACHEEIGARRKAGEGWHARLEGACADCHRDHRGDELIALDHAGFNHMLARFPLSGAHQKVACAKCHTTKAKDGGERLGFQEVPHDGCATCHDDPHTPSLGRDCARCHQVNGWTGRDLRFRHDRDCSFSLSGQHAALDCTACHRPAEGSERLGSAPFATTPVACAACHESPHEPSLGDTCTTCHSENGWTGRQLLFRHARDASFRLEGAHASLACTRCHEPATKDGGLASARLRGLPRSCSACHASPHRPSLGSDCTACHGQESWTGRALRFRHDADTSFPLTGAHRSAACGACHPAAQDDPRLAAGRLRGTPTDCAACHESPHRPAFEQDCTSCHTTASWSAARTRVDHAAFPLVGGHAGLDCARCHVPAPVAGAAGPRPGGATFRGLSTDCASCHTDPHEGSLAPKSCSACHDVRGFAPARFDHAKDARFALDAAHARLDCASCHTLRVFRPLPTTCAGCHTREAAAMEGRPGAGLPDGPVDPHAGKVTCTDCHDGSVPRAGARGIAALARACGRCHAPAYAGLHTARSGRLAELVTRAEAAARDTTTRARIEALRRWASHDYVPAEKRLRDLAGPAETK